MRARRANVARLERAQKNGAVQVLLRSHVRRIKGSGCAELTIDGEPAELAVDIVIVQIGDEPPTALLDRLGIQMDIRRGEPI